MNTSVIIEVKPVNKTTTIESVKKYVYDSSENLNEIAIHVKMPIEYKYNNIIKKKNTVYNSFFNNKE